MTGIVNLTKKNVPNLPWEKIKNKILGKDYNLSIVLAGNKRMLGLNKKHRGKNKIADTLSFPLSKKEGEIFLNAGGNPEKMLFCFIHSLLHLKGLKHGRSMSENEQKSLKIFKKLL